MVRVVRVNGERHRTAEKQTDVGVEPAGPEITRPEQTAISAGVVCLRGPGREQQEREQE